MKEGGKEGIDDLIGMAVALVGGKAGYGDTLIAEAGVTPLVGLLRVLVVRAVNFEDAPTALMENEKIHFASLAVRFGAEADFGSGEEEDAAIVEDFGDLDFTLRTEGEAVPCDGAVFGLRRAG